MADKQKASPPADNPVPRIRVDSSPDDSSPDTSSSSEKAREGGESSTDSPKPFSPFTSGADDSPVEGAVGQEPVVETDQELAEKARKLQIQATSLDKRGLHSGKVDVFRKYFNYDDLEFCTRPEGRQRHRAQRQRHHSEGGGGMQASDRASMENPLGALQVSNLETEAVLNQAGAIVGVDAPDAEFANLRGNCDDHFLPIFGRVGDPMHSVSSAPTVPIVEAYAGNYSPVEDRTSSEPSDRGMSSGSSFPSFPSHVTSSSGSFNLKISPLPDHLLAASRMSPVSTTDSEGVPPAKPVRRRRVGVTSHPLDIPARSKSAGASSGAIPRRKVSKDSSVDSSAEPASSDDEGATYPELYSQSVESECCLPMPDIDLATANLQQGMDVLRAAAGLGVPQNLETEDSSSEQDPVSVLSGSPDTAKEVKRPPPKDGA